MNGVEFMVTDLSDLLGKEYDLYHSLLSLLQKERRIVVDCSVADLIQTSKEKENLVLKIRILQHSRQVIIEELAVKMGLSPDVLTLSTLEEQMKEPLAGRLGTLCSKLSAVLQNIREVNEENRVFLEHSVDSMKGSLALIRYLTVSSSTYLASEALDGDRCNVRFVSEKS